MQIKQSWPHAETQERQLPLDAYPDTAPTSNHPAGWGKCSCFPNSTKHNPPNHITLLSAEKLLLLAWHQALSLLSVAEVGHSSNLGLSGKIWVRLFFPPKQKESAILQKWFAFSQPSHFSYQRCTCQNISEPRHVTGNVSLQLGFEKSQSVMSYLLTGRKLLPVSEQLQRDQGLVLKEL